MNTHTRPDQADVDALRRLLDLMENFPSNDQRARYLLSSNWMRDRNRGPQPCCDALTFDEHLENHYDTDTPDGL